MCEFCEGRKTIELKGNRPCPTVHVAEQKFLVIKDGDKKLVYDLRFCPKCGKKLSYESIERIYVTNITKDEIIDISTVAKPGEEKQVAKYKENPLHALICDKRFADSETVTKQIGFIITEKQLNQVKTTGYCDIVCSTGLCPSEE